MTPTPVWLLDVDGVLNAFQADPSRHDRTEAAASGRLFRIYYDPQVVRALREMHEEGLVELRWLTTWCDDANRSLAEAIGMPQLGVEGVSRYRNWRNADGWWKAGAAHEVARHNPDRLVFWSDDELALRTGHGHVPWLGARSNVIPISPNPDIGLTMKDVEAVRDVVTTLKEVSA